MILSIQLLRGIAAVLVGYIHAVQFCPGLGKGSIIDKSSLVTSFGGSGVDIFFVISGFVICLVANTKCNTFVGFMISRFNRVVPVYWFWTSLFALLMWFGAPAYTKDPLNIVCSYLFIPIMGLIGSRQPVLSVGWTLNYEILFYLSFSLIFYFRGRYRYVIILGLILFISYVLVVGIYNLILFEFAIGICIYYLWASSLVNFIGNKLSAFLLFLGFAVLFLSADISYHTGGWCRLFYWGGGSGLVLLGSLGLEKTLKNNEHKFRALLLLGNSSYTLYLTHWFWGFITYKLFSRFGLNVDIQVAATFLIMIFTGIFLHIYVEKFILAKCYIRYPGNSLVK